MIAMSRIALINGSTNESLIHSLQARAEEGSVHGYAFLADGRAEEVRLSFRQLDRQARAVASVLRRPGRAEGVALLPSGSGFPGRPVRLSVCRRDRRSPLPAAGQPLGRAPAKRGREFGVRPGPDEHENPPRPGAADGASASAASPRLARHLRDRGERRRDVSRAEHRTRRPGRPPVHLRFDRAAQGRDADPRRLAPQPDPYAGNPGVDPPDGHRVLAAGFSRHGADRQPVADSLHRPAHDGPSASRFRSGADVLAADDQRAAGLRQRRADLRLPPLRPAHDAGEMSGSGPELLEGGLRRRRAGGRGSAGPLRRGLRPVWLPPRDLLPLLRSGRGDAHGDGRRPDRASDRPLVLAVGPGRETSRAGRRRTADGRLRSAVAGPDRAHRRSGQRRTAFRGANRRNLGVRSQRRAAVTGIGRKNRRRRFRLGVLQTRNSPSCAPATWASSTKASFSSAAGART